jgi:hypothetical protein
MTRETRGHMLEFLDSKDRLNYGLSGVDASKDLRESLSHHCLLKTKAGLACFGIVENLGVGDQCVSFCRQHSNEVVSKLINFMFSDRLVMKYSPDDMGWQAVQPIQYRHKNIGVEIKRAKLHIWGRLDILDSEGSECNITVDTGVRSTEQVVSVRNVGQTIAQEFDFSKGWDVFQFTIAQNRFSDDDFDPESFLLRFAGGEELVLKFVKTNKWDWVLDIKSL